MTQAERKRIIEPHSVRDDFNGKAAALAMVKCGSDRRGLGHASIYLSQT